MGFAARQKKAGLRAHPGWEYIFRYLFSKNMVIQFGSSIGHRGHLEIPRDAARSSMGARGGLRGRDALGRSFPCNSDLGSE
jgi:hypothetical protein